MKLKLHDYQERAIEFCLEKKQVYLAVDLGMGKTAIALNVIRRSGQQALVFGPLRTIYNTWPDEIKKWTPELTYMILHGPQKSLIGIEHADILLINYEGLKWLSKQKYKWKRRMVIYDESSMVKSHSAQRFKMFSKMFPMWTDYRMCLSATPAPNGLHELWSQYYLLDKGRSLGKNISTFRQEFCTSFSYPGMAFTQYKVDPRFVQRIYDLVAPRTFRLDAKDYLRMPGISYNAIKVDLPTRIKKRYDVLEREFFDDELGIEAPNMALLGMKLRQFVQGGLYDKEKVWHRLHREKLNALRELMDTSAGQPILCAIQFRGELAMIQEAFPGVPVIAGGTSNALATKYITKWNAGSIPLLLCHPASISHGVNLQHGGHVLLWYGLTWSLEQYLQLNGRLYRQGQKQPVVIHHLVMKETIDEVVMRAISKKDAVQSDLLDYLREYSKGRGNTSS